MFQDILIPLDGSSRAEKVLPVAARLAHITDGTVSLLQAVWPPSVYMASVGEIVLPDILDETIPAAKVYLENVANQSSLEGIRYRNRGRDWASCRSDYCSGESG